jgi:hypothetical protein
LHHLANTRRLTCLSLCAVAMAALLFGCDGEGSEPSAMVMQPGQPQARAEVSETPHEEPPADEEAAPVYVTVDGVPYTFPPAKLYLKRQGVRVRARLLSDDPPEAVAEDWSGDSFFFEMDLELAGEGQLASLDEGVAPARVSPKELESAEWIFHRESSERSPTKSGIFLGRQSHLGGESHLQPISVSIMFDQVDEKTVMVTLEGVFADFDPSQPSEPLPRRTVRVLATLPADAINY